MAAGLILLQTSDAVSLRGQREQLTAVRTALAARESEVEELRVQLRGFESRYLRQVGVLYIELDEVAARIAEREVDLYDSDAARERAAEARDRARETQDAALVELAAFEEFHPPPTLKALFREVAKRIHPDYARDEAERRHLTLLMARANHAYRRGDIDRLERLLEDCDEVRAAGTEEDAASEGLRLQRQIRHAERDLVALSAEEQGLLCGEIGQLYRDAEAAAREHRDLLSELAASLREQIVVAQRSFELIDRQISAHGR